MDTRKATAVNMDKYDEKLQDMADARTGNSRRDQRQTQGKEKIRSKSGRRSGPQSNKSKQEEADRLRRLRLEVIKKRLNAILADNTGRSVEEITAACERDNFMTAEEAVAYGLIDKVIDKR